MADLYMWGRRFICPKSVLVIGIPNLPLGMAETTLVDGDDPRLKYTGDWFTGVVQGGVDQTSHGSTTLGSQLTFIFNGAFLGRRGRFSGILWNCP